jgi:hypothetical protein
LQCNIGNSEIAACKVLLCKEKRSPLVNVLVRLETALQFGQIRALFTPAKLTP